MPRTAGHRDVPGAVSPGVADLARGSRFFLVDRTRQGLRWPPKDWLADNPRLGRKRGGNLDYLPLGRLPRGPVGSAHRGACPAPALPLAGPAARLVPPRAAATPALAAPPTSPTWPCRALCPGPVPLPPRLAASCSAPGGPGQRSRSALAAPGPARPLPRTCVRVVEGREKKVK